MADPPDRPALREKYDRRQQEVVDAAAELIARRGFHATSVSDLREATGLTAGGLYHYIGSKEQLLFRIFERLMDPLLERAEEIARDDSLAPRDQLRELLRAWMSHVERHRAHMLVFQQEWHFVADRPEWSDARDARRRFEAILHELLDRAGLDAPDPGLLQLAVLGMVNYTPQWFDPQGRLSAEEIADGYWRLLTRQA